MKPKLTTGFLIFMISFNSVFSQTAYLLKYRFNNNDRSEYSGLLIRYNNGTSELRVKYSDPSTGIAKLDVEEYYPADAAGNEDLNTLIVKTSEPKDLSGNPVNLNTVPVFIFKLDPQTGFHEPAGLAVSVEKPELNMSVSFSSQFVATVWKDKTNTLSFFDKDADGPLYDNLFINPSRGGVSMSLTETEKRMNVKIHLLVVADTVDKVIGPYCKLDLNRMIESFDRIRKYIGIKSENFIVKTIQGKEFSAKAVKESIKGLNTSSNDIVVFYYSGHGFRTNVQDSFPYLYLKTNAKDSIDAVNNSLKMQDIFKMVRDKKARLKLVMSDCCNVNLETRKDTAKTAKKRGIEKWDFFEDNVRALFLSTKPVSILATAAKNGEKSWCNSTEGGFFSRCFKSTLQDYTSNTKTNVSWSGLMKELRFASMDFVAQKCCSCCSRQCPRVGCKQTPTYLVINSR